MGDNRAGPGRPDSDSLEVAERLGNAWNSHDASRVEALFAARCYVVDISDAAPMSAPAEVAAAYGRLVRAVPDLKLTADTVVHQGSQAAVFWTMCGSHHGALMRIPATGRPFAVQGAWLLNVRDGRIERMRSVWDVAGALRAMGLLPDL